MTDREAFCAVLATGPLTYGDALVVFSGDGTLRLEAALQALKQGCAHNVVVSGGVDDPPHSLTANAMATYLIGRGLAQDRVIRDGESRNTHEQAEVLAALCREHEWERVLLVASPYHMYRAFLTVLASLKAQEHQDARSAAQWSPLNRRALDEIVRVVPIQAGGSWWDSPAGMTETRLELLEGEFEKIERYGPHVASYREGLDYLRFWEGGEHDAD